MIRSALRKVVHFHDWLYYRCYCWCKKKSKVDEDPWVQAGITFDFILVNYAMVLSVILLSLFPALRKVPHLPEIWLAAALAILGLHLAFLHDRDRYKAIISKFENEGAEAEARGMRIYNWYWVALFLALLAGAMFAWLMSLYEGRGAG